MISKQRQMGYVDTTGCPPAQRYIFLSAKQLILSIDVNIVLTCSVQRLLGSPGSPDQARTGKFFLVVGRGGGG